MSIGKLPVVTTKGKPFARGQQYGKQAKKLVQRNVEVYFDMWRSLWNAGRPEILKKSRELVPVIGDYDVEILEEMEGIAKGAGLSLEEIVAINARYEINFSFGLSCRQVGEGCTSVIALPPVTKGGHTIIGQNWDWLTRFQEFNVILQEERDSGPNVVTQTEAGILAHRGMNSAGVGVCFNGLASSRDSFGQTVPFLLILRGVLNAENYTQSLQAVMRANCTLSANYAIAARGGQAIDLEVSPIEVGCVYPEGGILTHSNHFLALGNRHDFTDVLKRIYPDTLHRFQRARQLLDPERGHINIDSFQSVFSDHFSYPQSICRHPDPKAEGIKQWATLFSMIMDLDEPALYIAEGVPCKNQYHKITPSILSQG